MLKKMALSTVQKWTLGGSGIGSVLGAGSGYMYRDPADPKKSKKDRNRNALIGAGVGALGGGLYGYGGGKMIGSLADDIDALPNAPFRPIPPRNTRLADVDALLAGGVPAAGLPTAGPPPVASLLRGENSAAMLPHAQGEAINRHGFGPPSMVAAEPSASQLNHRALNPGFVGDDPVARRFAGLEIDGAVPPPPTGKKKTAFAYGYTSALFNELEKIYSTRRF